MRGGGEVWGWGDVCVNVCVCVCVGGCVCIEVATMPFRM